MSHGIGQAIHDYFDGGEDPESMRLLEAWIRASPANARQFCSYAELHDDLRSLFHAQSPVPGDAPGRPLILADKSGPGISAGILAAALLVVLAVLVMVWGYGLGSPALAAEAELNRLITAGARTGDRTFLLTVEESSAPARRERSLEDLQDRPPKPSLNGALLHVRGPGLFVLQRELDPVGMFVTGSNGVTGWAVRPEGPVRISPDPYRFNRDVPGHEHRMPLHNLQDGLEQLQAAYVITLIPVAGADEPNDPGVEPERVLVAVKKRGFRGPRRVEITYAEASCQIRQVRFVDMPFGPERLTLRMTQIANEDLGPGFFDHHAHHDPDREVVVEQ